MSAAITSDDVAFGNKVPEAVKSRVYSTSRKQTALPDGVWLSRGPLCCLSDYADNGCRIKRVHSAELQVRARVQLLEPPGTTGLRLLGFQGSNYPNKQ